MTTPNFILCTCPKKPEHYCKNWDGKGNAASRVEVLRSDCGYNPNDCEFLVETKKREGADWLYQTIAGTPLGKTAITTPEKEPEPAKKEPAKKPVKKQSLTCAECGEEATHKIEGYKPTHLCALHAKAAEMHGFHPAEIPEETTNA